MKLGDDMMVKNARILKVAVAVAVFALVGIVPWTGAAAGVPQIAGLHAQAGPEGPVIHLSVNEKVETVQYSPQPGVWVIEMPVAEWDQASGSLTAAELGIERAELSTVDEFGRRVTRLTVWLKSPATLDVAPGPDGLDLRFSPVERASRKAVDSEDLDVPPVAAAPAVEPATPPAQTAVVANPAQVGPEPARQGSTLLGVSPIVVGDGVVVQLKGDGPFKVKTFALTKPDRVVVDLPGVVSRVKRHLYRVDGANVTRVRVAQFRVIPTPITRVVVDVPAPQRFTFSPQAKGGDLAVGLAEGAEAEVQDRQGSIQIRRADVGADDGSPLHGAEKPVQQVRAEQEAPAEAPPVAAPVVSQAPIAAEKTDQAVTTLPPVRTEARPTNAQPDVGRTDEAGSNPWVADPKQLLEHASAKDVLGTKGADAYATKEVSSGEKQFTGEPISLRLKDADIKDVLRTFAALTNLNIVVDPSVSGSVTVDLHDVPWDQALDLILRINGLDYVLENNVLRVAQTAKLAAEKREKANLAKEQERAKPLKTVLKPLSYSKASYIKGLLTKDSELLSSRGSVVVDQRTNTLIIRDVVDRVEGVLRLIDSLDLPTPQVVIEGRIVETTRDFSHELGVNWGFTGVMDAAHGNDTGLNFPNSVGVGGGVNLGAKEPITAGQFPLETGGVVALTFGDILNTFNLDFTLRAAEVDGLVKIVSSPRVTTQNNEPASVQSGLQIPVQTIANNTVTVQYVDATLKLEVTPQITAEGTVLLDIKIRKREPAVGVNVQGGQNSPIFTRDAQTKLLVRDGGTTVIAGIYQINDQSNENSVPGLSKIPILGALFKSKKIFNRHDELLIFITPRIVKY